MKVVCYMSKSKRDDAIGSALERGFKRHGASVEVLRDSDFKFPSADVAVTVGTRYSSYKVYAAAKAAGQCTLMLDKGYFDRGRYHRMSINSPQPHYVSKTNYDEKRLRSIKPIPAPLQRNGKLIVYVEATQKYYDFHQLGDMRAYANLVCGRLVLLAHVNGLRVSYRPRLKAHDPIPPAPFDTDVSANVPMSTLLSNAHSVVVHGSTAGIEALLHGIPVVSLGDVNTNPVHDLSVPFGAGTDAIVHCEPPPREVVLKRAAQLAWCQFTLAEIGSGMAWEHLRPWMYVESP